jgi:hypothetical protein
MEAEKFQDLQKNFNEWNQRAVGLSSSPKITGLKAQELPMFQFKSDQ